MLTPAIVATLEKGTTLFSTCTVNHDSSPLRVRVSGRAQLWKTRPADFSIPVTYGYNTSFRITQEEASQWSLCPSSTHMPA